MKKVISLEEVRAMRKAAEEADFSKQLKRIVSFWKDEQEDETRIENSLSLQDWFHRKIAKELVRRRMIESDIFLCGLYAAKILSEFGLQMPRSLYAVDFLQEWSTSDNPDCLKCGGDFCFLLCGIFPARGDRKTMHIEDYRQMGTSFYYHFYATSGSEIGLHMSSNFQTMQDVVWAALNIEH